MRIELWVGEQKKGAGRGKEIGKEEMGKRQRGQAHRDKEKRILQLWKEERSNDRKRVKQVKGFRREALDHGRSKALVEFGKEAPGSSRRSTVSRSLKAEDTYRTLDRMRFVRGSRVKRFEP